MGDYQLYLASNSPRRRELLEQIGVSYRVLSLDIDESAQPHEDPLGLVQRLALTKARRGRKDLPPNDQRPVLGADTLVFCEGRTLGKPQTRSEGLEMLATLSGRTHSVLTAVALVNERQEKILLNRSQVRFREISPLESNAYWDTGEPADKAGGYAIQGLGALFVAELIGSYSGVMGLPLFETAQLLNEFGIELLESRKD